jgi:glycosyltransferase involved in cell wall biosynthesis
MQNPEPKPRTVAGTVARIRTVSQLDRALRWISKPRLGELSELPQGTRSILLYSPSNLNLVDGSAIWVRSVVETLLVDPDVVVTVPLRAPVRREVMTGPLRKLDRVDLVDIHPRLAPRASGLSTPQALNLFERLDAMRPFDEILLRSFVLCGRAVDRPRLRGRIWSCYILEPERDPDAPEYRAEMSRIAEGSKYVAVQSEGMRELLESVVPAARGKTVLLPPAVPDDPPPPAPDQPVRRLIYTGKFHPFYPVEQLIGAFTELRRDVPDLEFHVAGDKFMPIENDPGYPARMESLLRGTPGVVWHGSLSREATTALVAEGGIALNVWDYRHGPRMNDLVVSTKLLDYATARVPIVLTRTRTQVDLLGEDYPLFVDSVEEALPVLRRVLADADLYRRAADRAFEASRAYTYPAVHRLIAPYLDGATGGTDGGTDGSVGAASGIASGPATGPATPNAPS